MTYDSSWVQLSYLKFFNAIKCQKGKLRLIHCNFLIWRFLVLAAAFINKSRHESIILLKSLHNNDGIVSVVDVRTVPYWPKFTLLPFITFFEIGLLCNKVSFNQWDQNLRKFIFGILSNFLFRVRPICKTMNYRNRTKRSELLRWSIIVPGHQQTWGLFYKTLPVRNQALVSVSWPIQSSNLKKWL